MQRGGTYECHPPCAFNQRGAHLLVVFEDVATMCVGAVAPGITATQCDQTLGIITPGGPFGFFQNRMVMMQTHNFSNTSKLLHLCADAPENTDTSLMVCRLNVCITVQRFTALMQTRRILPQLSVKSVPVVFQHGLQC